MKTEGRFLFWLLGLVITSQLFGVKAKRGDCNQRVAREARLSVLDAPTIGLFSGKLIPTSFVFSNSKPVFATTRDQHGEFAWTDVDFWSYGSNGSITRWNGCDTVQAPRDLILNGLRLGATPDDSFVEIWLENEHRQTFIATPLTVSGSMTTSVVPRGEFRRFSTQFGYKVRGQNGTTSIEVEDLFTRVRLFERSVSSMLGSGVSEQIRVAAAEQGQYGSIIAISFPDAAGVTQFSVWKNTSGLSEMVHQGSGPDIDGELAYSPKGKYLVRSNHRRSYRWSLDTPTDWQEVFKHGAAVKRAIITPDERHVLFQLSSGDVEVWEEPTRRLVVTLTDLSPDTKLDLSYDGKVLAAYVGGRQFSLIDLGAIISDRL